MSKPSLVSGALVSSQAKLGDAPLVGGTFLAGLAYMIRQTPEFLQQSTGVFGWFDTYLPAWSYWPVVAVIGAVLFLAVGSADRRAAIVLIAVLVACVAVPALVQARSVSQTGIIWQGR